MFDITFIFGIFGVRRRQPLQDNEFIRRRQYALMAVNNQFLAGREPGHLTSRLKNYPYEPWPLDMAGSAPRDADDIQALAYDPSAYPHFMDLPNSAAA